jgi:NosR/NirI family transcriptional regulator, nitrous oxide reductase regulator
LIISLFVGRPYCRFFCPYSVLLNLCSQVSQWRVTVGPGEGECVQCASCEEACPFDLITYPTPKTMEPMSRHDKTRIAVLVLIAPVCILLGGWITSKASDSFARVHATVRLAEQVALEDAGQVTVTTEASQAFRDSAASKVELFAQANQIRSRFATGSWILGGFLALVIIAKLIVYSIKQERTYYEADRGSCLACGRCYCSCPLDKKWRKIQAAAAVQRDGV